ncbi:MAG TPA: prepilin-type N-terminal cleavage/methylation domain-containing protein [bacterium]|nr:prepilin-type N-terminal cleavage/methylation domain-containing protein [bacterium]HPN30823.1 prepilin-type N-terminal cleavage/methylation domain-containing protein [bacterium]
MKKAFTLIELLIVAVIISIAAFLSYPAFNNFLKKINPEDKQNKFKELNLYCSNLAKKNNRPVKLVLTGKKIEINLIDIDSALIKSQKQIKVPENLQNDYSVLLKKNISYIYFKPEDF